MKSPSPSPLPDANGVYSAPTDVSDLRARFEQEGGVWRTLDLYGVADKRGLLKTIAAALGFPAHFGRNWDALADSLEDLSWLAGKGVVLEVQGADAFRAAAGDAWPIALDILERAAKYWAQHGRTFLVLVRGAGGPKA